MKIGFLSLGCPKNLVDGEVMLGIAKNAGHEIVNDAPDADVLVVNTCAFIDNAKQESIDAILEMAAFKRDGNAKRLVVTGCLAERYRDELRKEIPEIDALLGTGEVEGILDAVGGSGPGALGSGSGETTENAVPLTFFARPPQASYANPEPRVSAFARSTPADLAKASGGGGPDPDRRQAPTYIYDASTPRLLTTPKHFAYVKIAEGCDYTCAFCIIPTLRGSYRSRTIESIVREAQSMAEGGVRELLLISQDTSFYGNDRGERGALARLLRALNGIDGLTWIRLLYLYPTTITDDVLAAMADCEKVCRYIDLPLQHASAAVLKRMRRPGNRRTYDRLLDRIRTRVPGVTLRTTLIVGFPGETDEDFAELEAFVADQRFDHLGVFTYSHEDGTRAFALSDDVPAPVKRRRRNAVMARQKRLVAQAHRARLGSEVEILIDGASPDHPMVIQGRLEGQAPDIDSSVYLTACDPSEYAAGDLIRARVVSSRGYDLVAMPLEAQVTTATLGN